MKTTAIILALFLLAYLGQAQENTGTGFDGVVKYNDNYSWSYKNGKKGLIDKTDKSIIPSIYDEITSFNDSIAWTYLNGKKGLIHISGKIIIPNIYDEITGFKNGYAYTTKEGKKGMISKDGSVMAPNIYDDIIPFRNGYAWTYKNEKKGLIGPNGDVLIQNEFSILNYSKGVFKGIKDSGPVKLGNLNIPEFTVNNTSATDTSRKINITGEIRVQDKSADVIINNDSLWVAEKGGKHPDTTTIVFKKGKIIIVKGNNNGNDTLDFGNMMNDGEDEYGEYYHDNKFHGNLAGFEFGLNNFLNNKQKMELPDDAKSMELNTGQSWQFGFNFMHKSIGFTKNCGLVAGLGFAFNNYRFDKQIVLLNDSTPIKFSLDTTHEIKKNKLFVAYITLPLLFEYQIPVDKAKLHFALGVIGSIKIGSRQKQIYENNEKFVRNRDFHLNPFKCEATARIGYGPWTAFANYSLTTLFEKEKGPELYPVTVGMGLTF